MKKILAGTLVLLTGILGMATTATAAEIPPTPECVELNKKLSVEYHEATKGKFSQKKQTRANRKMLNQLVEAGCLSDSAPLLKEMKAKPNTEQCAVAADAASTFWAPHTKEMTSLLNKSRRATKPLRKQTRRLSKKIRKLQAKAGSKKRIKSLKQSRTSVQRKIARIDKPFVKKLRKSISSQSDATELILAELIALRCLSGESIFEGYFDEKPKLDPVTRKLKPHLMFVFMTFLFELEKSLDSNSGSASISSADLDLESLAGKSLPLPILNR